MAGTDTVQIGIGKSGRRAYGWHPAADTRAAAATITHSGRGIGVPEGPGA